MLGAYWRGYKENELRDRTWVAIVGIVAAACVAMVALICFTQIAPPQCPSGKVWVNSGAQGCMTPNDAKGFVG